MCLGVPMRVVGSAGLLRATCDDRGRLCEIDTSLVGPVAEGVWLMTFLGAAREIMDAASAHRSLAALAALESIMSGDEADIAAAFPDLIGREPQLPEHLRQGDPAQ